MFLFVGNMSLIGEGGITVFRYDPNSGATELLGTQHTDVSAGHICIDKPHSRLFCVNERLECNGIPGGEAVCYRINSATGDLVLLSRTNTYTVLPCYVCYLANSNRLMVCNHAKRDYALRLTSCADGLVRWEKVFDDAVLEVFDVQKDGSISGPSTFWVAPSSADASDNPHLHSITYDEQNEQAYVCDTGGSRVYSVSCEKGRRLSLLQTVTPDIEDSSPRYGVLHPRLSTFYFNSEKHNSLFVYTIANRRLIPLQRISVVQSESSSDARWMQSAVAINAAGTVLYALTRMTSSISVFNILPDGRLLAAQTLQLLSVYPRSLAISPDGRFVFVVCSQGKSVIRIKISDDGRLFDQSIVADSLSSPSSMVFGG